MHFRIVIYNLIKIPYTLKFSLIIYNLLYNIINMYKYYMILWKSYDNFMNLSLFYIQ